METEITYPISLRIKNKKCLVVGGGRVAARKILDLLVSGAIVTVVSPEICPEIKAQEDEITLILRPYEKGDEKGAFLVLAATDSRAVNEEVYKNAHAAGILVNVADTPDICDFYIPSRIRRGPLMVTIATSGKVPGLSRKIRKELEPRFGDEYEIYLSLLSLTREELMAKDDLDTRSRGQIMAQVLNLDLLPLIRQGLLEKARKEIAQCVSRSSG